MSEENFLIPVEELGLSTLEDNNIAELTRSSDFLPQIRVMGSANEIVKKGQFPIGHFGLYFSADNILDLDEQFDCLVVSARARASIVSGEAPITFYTINSNEFQDIKNRSLNGEQGYMCGLEYLIWIPQVSKFALFFCGNKTLRRESEKVKALIGKAATLKIRFIKTSKYSWHGFSCYQCSTPFSNIPPMEDIKAEIARFNAPPESQVELAEESDRER